MKKAFFLLIALAPVLVKAQGKYTVHGKLEKPVKGKIELLWYNIATGLHKDSTMLDQGKFVFKGTVKGVQTGQLIFGDMYHQQSIVFYVEPGNIHIDYPAGAAYAKLSGTPLNNDLQQYNVMLYAMLDSMNATRSTAAVYHWWDKAVMPAKIGIIDKFVTAHPASQVGLDQLDQYAIGNKAPDVIESIYKKFSPVLKKSSKGVELASRIDGMRSADVGDVAPAFTLPDSTGRKVSLSDFRGKYVLIDFWATWCGPCMAEMPNVAKAYEQYNSKGFEIIGVSLDRPDSKEKWEKVIRRDHLNWIQVSDLNWWNSKAALVYNVNSVPANFLVDPQGKIIAKDLRGEALQKKLASLFE